ncbi:malto-oligosyltrehalose synthase [Mobilicoccus pelagius]|uniref:Maltooligosyl trehalose synthase n=1 Tax=Mobilicoccus pelagius NBRC 104925 TaxID=1089455 RepID=H5UN33_9MICO|nr:malto-oligosyltrehalose synthase [Mobilicoccus pelagius]GAB47141.1 maltooligosyl trehalose synthase [Mobilicoccus pelagius NBRC 104925]
MNVTGTYRLQMHEGFGFDDARRQLPYLASLGVSHLYLSPILQAAAGSMHGYDVVDHTRISDELGGREGFEALAEAAHEFDMGIVVDVVPNHMAFVAPEYVNRPLWQVLTDGRDAETAEWFDIDWKAGGGRLGLPILGDDLDAVLEAGEITRDEMEIEGVPQPVLRYYEHVLPIALGTEGDEETSVRDVLDRQHYRLASWRDKENALNYRRFFEVDQLIAVRVEIPEVFEATHALLLELNRAGLVDGFRIDHPDGLADPAGYLDQLHRASRRGTPVWVEKILEGTEELPTTWRCAGTTGYDGMRAITAALVDTDPQVAETITRCWDEAGGEHTVAEAVDAAKRQVVAQSLGPEVERLTRRAREALPEADPERLRQAVVELLVAGEVYRAYVRPDQRLTPEAHERLTTAFAAALEARPDLEPELRELAPLTVAEDDDEAAAADFAVRLQQTWGPVMAKGIEDTTFYRWHRLVALNEVGGDPELLDHGSPEDLHAWARNQEKNWPLGMVALSTHDTKRSEDVRARILAVAGDPESWAECSRVCLERAAEVDIDTPTVHLIWQTILGVGRISRERMEEYLLKALREAKQHTAWVDGDPDYERRVLDFAERVTHEGRLHDAIDRALEKNAEAVRAMVLAQKVLQLTVPGVPDTYQGCEVLELSLVDPDNRRAVAYPDRAELLRAVLDAGVEGELPVVEDLSALDAEKMLVTTTLLRLRRESPELFENAGYAPLEVDAPLLRDHLVGFTRTRSGGFLAGALGRTRGRVVVLVTRAPARLAAAGGWGESVVTLEEGEWTDVLTGTTHTGGDRRVADVLARRPVAVLVQR